MLDEKLLKNIFESALSSQKRDKTWDGYYTYGMDYRRYFLFNVIKHQFSLDRMSMGNTSIFMHVFVCKYIMNKSILVEGAPTKGMESIYVAHLFFFLCTKILR